MLVLTPLVPTVATPADSGATATAATFPLLAADAAAEVGETEVDVEFVGSEVCG